MAACGERAQPADRMRQVGILSALTAHDPEGEARVAAFRELLQKLGWVDRKNLQVDVRWSGDEGDRIRKNATDLAALAPDVILGLATRRSGCCYRQSAPCQLYS